MFNVKLSRSETGVTTFTMACPLSKLLGSVPGGPYFILELHRSICYMKGLLVLPFWSQHLFTFQFDLSQLHIVISVITISEATGDKVSFLSHNENVIHVHYN